MKISKLAGELVSKASSVEKTVQKTVSNDLKTADQAIDGAVKDAGWLAQRTAQQIDPSLTPYPSGKAAWNKETQAIDARLNKRIPTLSPQQKQVMTDLRSLGVSDVDLMHGSHVVVQDNGRLYDKWSKLGARPRSSSHYPNVKTQQYEIDFKGIGPLLFGKTAQGNTWFQFEGHPFGKDLKDDVLHLTDYVIHKATGDMNVGPMGLSPHSEKTGKQIVVPDPKAQA